MSTLSCNYIVLLAPPGHFVMRPIGGTEEGWPDEICAAGAVDLMEKKGALVRPWREGDLWRIEFTPSAAGPFYFWIRHPCVSMILYIPRGGAGATQRDYATFTKPQVEFIERHGANAAKADGDHRGVMLGFDFNMVLLGAAIPKIPPT